MTPNPATKNRPTLYGVLFLAVCAAALFALSVYQRSDWFGATANDMTGALTTGTTLQAKQWHQEGPWHRWFIMYWEPDSIEYPTLESRTPYVSYPPGAILPIYLLGKFSPRGPTCELTMAYNLANQYCIGLVLALLVFFILRAMNFPLIVQCLTAVVPIILYFWMPSPFYEHLLGYFADQAIILPYALLVFLEVSRETTQSERLKRWLPAFQGLVLFWGFFTDWLFPFVALAVYLMRVARGQMGTRPIAFVKRSFWFWFPAGLALGLYALQLYKVHAFTKLALRFIHRSGVDGGGLNALRPVPKHVHFDQLWTFTLDTFFWQKFVPFAYGMTGKILILANAAFLLSLLLYALIQRLRRKSLASGWTLSIMVLYLFLVPCFAHYHIFKNHSSFMFHFFSVLKLAPGMAVIPFAVVPMMIAARWIPEAYKKRAGLVLALLLLVSASVYAYSLGNTRAALFRDLKLDRKAMAQFVGAHTGYNDVVFSVDQIVQRHFVVYSMKSVHRVRNIVEIHDIVKDIQGPYIINLFAKGQDDWGPPFNLVQLANLAYEEFHEGDCHLRKIRKEDFLKYYQSLLDTSNPPLPPQEKAP